VAGTTLRLVPVTIPGFGPALAVISSASAPAADHARVVDAPAMIVAGVAAKAAMVGGGGNGTTVTVAVFVTLPPALVAVSV